MWPMPRVSVCRLASIFLASKVENEYIKVEEVMAVFSMEGEGKLRDVIEFELLLLQVGTRCSRRCVETLRSESRWNG